MTITLCMPTLGKGATLLLLGILSARFACAQTPAPTTTQLPSPTASPVVPVTAASQEAATPEISPPPTPAVKKIAFGSCRVDGPYIAMTFDDGPNARLTPLLLDAMESRGIHATFFVVGSNAVLYPDLLKRMAQDGDEIGNHSWSHPQLSKLDVAKADKEILDTSDVITKATGQAPLYLRPPYGAMSPLLRKRIEDKFGMTLIYWSVDPRDWKYRDSQHVYDEILRQVKPGAIILSHDIHATTVAAMPHVFDALLAKGYKFVTVSQLIALNQPRAIKPAASPMHEATSSPAPSHS